MEDFDERQSRLNGLSEAGSVNSVDIDELDDLELIAETYRDVFEGSEDFDRALKIVKDFIRLAKDSRISGYMKRAETEKILNDLDEFRRKYLDIVSRPAEMLYKDLRPLILRICGSMGGG